MGGQIRAIGRRSRTIGSGGMVVRKVPAGIAVAGQDNGHPRPSRWYGLGEDATFVQIHELFGDTQAQAQPALAETEVAGGVAAGIELREERLEEVRNRLRLEAHAPILHDDLGLVRHMESSRQLDLPSVRRELDGVGQEINQDRADLVRIDLECTQVRGRDDVDVDSSGVQEGRT